MKIRRTHRFWALLLTLAMLVSLVSSVFASETAATMQLTRTEGTVRVVNAGGRDVSVREKLRLYGGYAVKTEEKSYAWIALDDTKLAKLDAASEVEIHRNGKKLELLLRSGSVYFNVTEPLEEEETLNICTSSMIAGIRGTTGWVSMKNSRSGLGVLEGRVLCTTVENSVWVEPGQLTSFDNSGGMMSEKIDLEETPGYVLVEVVTDPELCAEIEAASGLEVANVTPEQAAAKLEADEAEIAVEMGKLPEPDPVSDSSDSGSSGGGSSQTVTPVEPEELPKEQEESQEKQEESQEKQEESQADPGEIVGPFTVKGGEKGTDYSYSDEVLTILTATPLTISNTDNTTPTNSRIEVSKDAEGANVTLAGVNIEIAKNVSHGAFLIPYNYEKNVTVYLKNGAENVLKSGVNYAGLDKGGVSSGQLTIKGGGSLTATGGSGGAGIGGGFSRTGKNIKISDGIVTASGGGGGAGIGGGSGSNSGNGENITISGGIVTAKGGAYAAGIGGGGIGNGSNNGNGENIMISGGIVTAKGGTYAAGIGGGGSGSGNRGGNGENITISGSKVTAIGGENSAGIGGGYLGNGADITISGGIVEATGGSNKIPGIGNSNNASTINARVENNAFVYIKTGKTGSGLNVTKGIVFYPNPATVSTADIKMYGLVVGDVALEASASIPDYEKLTIQAGSTLTIPNAAMLKDLSKIDGGGIIKDSAGTVHFNGTAAATALLSEEPEAFAIPEPPAEPEQSQEESPPEVPAAVPVEPTEPEDDYTLSSDTRPPADPATYLADPPPEAPAPETYAITPDTTVYEDVPPNAWYAEAVQYCQEKGLMNGTDGTRFTPNGALTQSMTASWDEGAGLGYPGDTPDQAVTREELAVLLWRKAGSPESASALPFADAGLLSAHAVQAAAWANEKGLITGKPGALLDPLAAVTRAEAATILMRRDLAAAAPALAVGNSVVDVSLGANGITADDDGSLLVTDVYNRKIWRINDGRASIHAGGDTVKDVYDRPQGGYLDAPLLESYFGEPWAIAPWGGGWAVSDAANDALRLLTGERVETISKDFSHPTGLAADGAGNLYISDTFNGTIRKLDANGKLSVAASGLNDPMGLCWKDGALYIAETGANRISRLDGATLSVVAGSGEEDSLDGAAGKAAFSAPRAVTVADDGSVYVSDSGNSSIRRIRNGWVSTVAARDYSAGDLRLIDPSGLLLRGDSLLVCDTFARTVLEFPVD